jgi:hypothetical protein
MKSKKIQTFKKKISSYILKKGDICCEDDFDRKKLIDQIFNVFKDISPTDYLDTINNDIILFIGYFIDLKKSNDKKGIQLWSEMNSQMPLTKNKKQDEKNIRALLFSLPLFYLLSFLGMANYKNNDLRKY